MEGKISPRRQTGGQGMNPRSLLGQDIQPMQRLRDVGDDGNDVCDSNMGNERELSKPRELVDPVAGDQTEVR